MAVISVCSLLQALLKVKERYRKEALKAAEEKVLLERKSTEDIRQKLLKLLPSKQTPCRSEKSQKTEALPQKRKLTQTPEASGPEPSAKKLKGTSPVAGIAE